MYRARWEKVGALALIVAMGLVLGAALARWAVESLFYGATFFYGWLPTIAFSLAAAGLLTLFSLWLARQRSDPATTTAVALSLLPISLLLAYLVNKQVDTSEASVLLVGTLALAAALLDGQVQRHRPHVPQAPPRLGPRLGHAALV